MFWGQGNRRLISPEATDGPFLSGRRPSPPLPLYSRVWGGATCQVSIAGARADGSSLSVRVEGLSACPTRDARFEREFDGARTAFVGGLPPEATEEVRTMRMHVICAGTREPVNTAAPRGGCVY